MPNHVYYQSRFVHDSGRSQVWQAICEYLNQFISPTAHVLDMGAGYCSFINHIKADEKHALDIFPGFVEFAHPGVQTHVGRCDDLSMFSDGKFDAVFASNLLEHLSREEIVVTMKELRRVLKPLGLFVIIQPNFYYCYREYFDDYTHIQIFTHTSLPDLLSSQGFQIEVVEPRFLPFSFKSRLPKWMWLVRLYLKLPFRPFAKQMLVIGRLKDNL